MQPDARSAHSFLALVLLAAAAGAQTPTLPGHCLRRIPVGHEITGIAQGPGGAWGESVYVTGNGVISRVDLDSGQVSPFASGLATGAGRPSGAVFDTGAFGSGLLYVSQNAQSVGVLAVQPSGAHALLSGGGTLFSCNDIAMPKPGGAFGDFAFVTNGSFAQLPSISKVDVAGVNAQFHTGAGFNTIIGLEFPPQGSGFGANLFVGDYGLKQLFEVDAQGKTTPFPPGGPVLGQVVEDLTFSPPGGPFGDHLFVTTADTRRVLRIDPQGNVQDFVTGLAAMNGYNGDLTFTRDGDHLLVGNFADLLVISTKPWVSSYCTAKTNSCGSVPAISGTGVPSASASAGFVVSAAHAKAQKSGLLIYTDRGPGSLPFQGGTLCVSTQNLRRSVVVSDSVGTPPSCDGSLSLDMNAFAHGALGGNPAAFLLQPGTQVNCQFWGRDTVANGSLLSDALVYGVCP